MGVPREVRTWFFVTLVFILGALFAFPGQCGAAQSKDDSLGKYPASLLIETRTASTYPEGLYVLTLVTNHFDFTRRREGGT